MAEELNPKMITGIVLGNIRRKTTGMAECAMHIILNNEVIYKMAKHQPDAAVNRLPLPVFKTNYPRIVQLANETFNMCRILAKYCAVAERRCGDDAEELAFYAQRFIDETGDPEQAANWLALSPLEFLTGYMAVFQAKQAEVEQLAAEIRDCADANIALIAAANPAEGKEDTVAIVAQSALEMMARQKTFCDVIEEQLELLRRLS